MSEAPAKLLVGRQGNRAARSCAAPRTSARSTSRSSARRPGLITLDYGYVNTGATESAITYIDGDAGHPALPRLRHRGLAEQDHPSFLETAYLLIYGELPTAGRARRLQPPDPQAHAVHEDVKRFYDGFPKDAHPMATLASVVNALATFYQYERRPA